MKSFYKWLMVVCAMLSAVSSVSQVTEESVERQLSGTIKGTVVDAETQQPLPGVTVQITGTERGAYTDINGDFEISKVPIGAYLVDIRSVGYQPLTRTDIIVKPGRITTIPVELTMTPVPVKGIRVTAGYFHEIQDQPTSATNFTGEEIRRAPGSAGDVSRIVMVLPSVAQVNDQLNSLVVRGGSPVENAFYIDNIEIPNINHYPIQGTSGGPIGLLNVDFIQNVNFSAGGFSATYGDRLSSVMEIEFREGNRDEFDAQLDLSFAGFGAVAEGPLLTDRGSFMISGRRSYLDMLVDVIGVGTAPKYGDYQGKLVYDLSPANKMTVLGIYGWDGIEWNPDQSRDDGMPIYGPFKGYEYAFGANWKYLWNRKGYSNTSLSIFGTKYISDVFETKAFFDSTVNGGKELRLYQSNSLEQIVQLRSVNNYRFNNRISTEFGFDFKYFYNDYFYNSAPYTNAIGDSIEAVYVDKIMESPKYGLYTSLNLRLTGRLTANAGLRYDYFPFNKRQYVSPRLALTYQLSERFSLKSATGIYYQSLPLVLISQKDEFERLRDPRAYHYILGFDYLLTPETKLTVEAYYKDYRNFPVDPNQPQLFLADELSFMRMVGLFENLDDNGLAESYGLEGTIQKKLADDIYGMASASYFRSKYRDYRGVWRNRLFDNRFIASMEGGYKPNNKWEFSLRWIFAGGPPFTPLDEELSEEYRRTVMDRRRVNMARHPDYHSLNIRLDRRYSFKRSSLIVYFSVWNAYNRKNIGMYFWNEVENRPDVEYQWMALPVGGFEFEF